MTKPDEMTLQEKASTYLYEWNCGSIEAMRMMQLLSLVTGLDTNTLLNRIAALAKKETPT